MPDRILASRPLRRTVGQARRHIDKQNQCELTLLPERLGVRRVHTRAHIPVDQPGVIALNVLAHLVKLDPRPAKDRPVVTGKQVLHQPGGEELNTFDTGQESSPIHRFLRDGHGGE